MRISKYIIALCCFSAFICHAQHNKTTIDAKLDYQNKELKIQQKITYHNVSKVTLDTLYFHNWAASYKNRHTPLSKRLIEDYDKSLYFAKSNLRGGTIIKNISSNYVSDKWFIDKNEPDIIKVILNKPLKSHDSVVLSLTYITKVPSSIFTEYGQKDNTYNLRYWYITPAVFDGEWQTMSNLNMDDLYMQPSAYNIKFSIPQGVHFNTDLKYTKSTNPPFTTYHLKGKNRIDIELNFNVINDFIEFETSPKIITNLNGTSLSNSLKTDIVTRELAFIEEHIGKYPHDKLLVNSISYSKNPIYGLNQLPKMFNPFSGAFEWDIKMFKALTRKYLENTIIVNRRKDAWILDGIQNFLMIKYVEQYYPEIKALGNISKIWGVRSFNVAKLGFNDKYPFVYQFAARKNYDQALTTRADSLSNFNRKIVNKYKAGLGLQYLDEYLNDSIVFKSIKQFYSESLNKETNSNLFQSIITEKSDKDLSWFFGDYINTKKKIDYTIKKIKQTKDSVEITIKNRRNITVPIALYGINKKEITFRKWLTDIDSTTTISIPKGDYDRLSLNYEYLYPELNLRDNWKNLKGLLNKPIQFRFFKDVENPYYNQVFYNFYAGYNLYDGLILGPSLYNEAIFKKKWLYKITPTYGTNSGKITGAASFVYQHIPEETSVYRYRIGISASNFHYDKNLSYVRISPFASVEFKRKSLRDVGGSALSARYVIVNKEIPKFAPKLESDNYNILNLRYGYTKPDIIQDLRYNVDFQLAEKFSKLALDFRYRKLTDTHRQYDFRLYFGTFLSNKTESDFFSFSLDRPSDYLFDYNFLGRSEKSGFLSQQIIIAEGGFKSMFDNPYANQWMLSTNNSMSIWSWIEAYADAGFYKNKNNQALFRYDSGIRLNFVHNFFEVYFPIQSSLGFEPSRPNYASKIRFVITLAPEKLIGLIRRGFF
ncbi:M1 family metallopeptidase [Aureibaculum algae]|uniref:M1 family metallopeptidase n=1 Tax=Aureibaculum algae TaxID=2584122 RepID=A0A5B7TWT2_9FLAO|nr:M1 family metallopeptidase [Aureibaculum algae]QCX39771.1 M1 family metallopeptidase [Aureibaculum algae]